MSELITEKQEPAGTYAAVTFDEETEAALYKYCEDNDIPHPDGAGGFHCTIAYSRKHLPDYNPINVISPPWIAEHTGFEVWPSGPNAFKDQETYCLVMTVKCPELVDRFNFVMDEYGATYDYDEYKPHVTLSYNVDKDLDISQLPMFGDITIVREYCEDLKPS